MEPVVTPDESSEIRQPDWLSSVLAESTQWQRIMALEAQQQIDLYLDLKSPHAYLAVRPSLELARDYAVRVNILPFTLSYEELGLTTSVKPDRLRRPPNAAADRKARMYYTAAREYAALQGLPFRTPQQLLDSALAHKALLFAKQQSLEVPFLMHVYLHGWGSGWRSYQLDSAEQLQRSLAAVGASAQGFEDFVGPLGPGSETLARIQQEAIATGCTGVPHYVFTDSTSGRQLGLFGREHLALIRQKLHQAGLARHSTVRAEISHAWRGPSVQPS